MTTLLVIPAYNEARRLDLQAYGQALAAQAGLQLLFVDDGSTDATVALLRAFMASHPDRIGIRQEPINRGKAEAVRRGMLQALDSEAGIVGFWDADLATPLGELPALIAPLERDPAIQVVLGSRVRLLGRRIERRAQRHYLGRIFATAVSFALRAPIYDTQCGAKLFRPGAPLRDALTAPFRSRWIFDVELLARLDRRIPGGLLRGACEVPLREWTDVAGSQVRWHAFLRAPFDLASIYWREVR
ncbi:MAG TPA: glycosyltransferase [Gemmatimonadales bacterium]|jgi:glycosyltransferase involved in cell wall biosynthesis|nr:glycosyltransferase [Gemmatimonadales bacterium]